MILVIGATGYLGGEICRRLAAKGKQVRAMVRANADSARVEALRAAGIELASGDLKDGASLDAACRGVETVISTASSTISHREGDTIESVDRDGQLRLLDAARRAGVDHFIFISYSGNIEIESPLGSAKRGMEQAVRTSGMAYTILRPSIFMEVWLSPALGFDPAGGKAQIYGSGERKVSYISLGDVAEFTVAAVDSPAARNRVIELGGPEALSQLEAVRTFEETLGRKMEVQAIPEDALRAQLAGATDSLQKSFAALMLGYAQGDEIDMSDTLREFPVKLTSVRDHARRSAGAAAGGTAGEGATTAA